MTRPSVCVTLVTCNSRPYIGACLESVLRQDYPVEVVVVDNASLDGTRLELAPFRNRVRVLLNDRNTGFASAQNQAISACRSDWVLTLNPDVLLHPGFVAGLLDSSQHDTRVGTLCGKLLRIGKGFEPLPTPVIDSTGIYFTPNLRHFDRGSGDPDEGQYPDTEYVFGASAAAAMYRRDMIEDVSGSDGFFDPDFFAYREDADVAWRAQLLGWRCLYVPAAVGHHVRRVRPGPRGKVPAVLNMHSVKNRFLMRVKNTTGAVLSEHWAPIVTRDLLIAGGCLFYEPSSLPAFWKFAKALPAALRKRKDIMARRRVSDEYLAQWFAEEPRAVPLPEYALR